MNKELIKKVETILTPEDVSSLRSYRPKALQQVEGLRQYMNRMDDPMIIVVNKVYKDTISTDDRIEHLMEMISVHEGLDEKSIISDARALKEELDINLILLRDINSEP